MLGPGHTGQIGHGVVNTAVGTGTIVPAAAGKRVRVMALSITTDGGGLTVMFQSGDGTPLSGTFTLNNNQALQLPHQPYGWFESKPGQALVAVIGGSGNAGGVVIWEEI